MPETMPSRSICVLQETVAHHLKAHRDAVRSRTADYISISREFTTQPFHSLVDALRDNMLGTTTFHVEEAMMAANGGNGGNGGAREGSVVPKSLRPESGVSRHSEVVKHDFAPAAFGIVGGEAETIAKLHSCTRRVDAVVPRVWNRIGIADDPSVPLYDAPRLAMGLLVQLDGRPYPPSPRVVPVVEGDEIAYRDLQDPSQHAVARPIGWGGNGGNGGRDASSAIAAASAPRRQLDEAIDLEACLSLLVHGERADEFNAIGTRHRVGLSGWSDRATLVARVRAFSIKEIASDSVTAARLVGELVDAERVRALVMLVDALLHRVVRSACAPGASVGYDHEPSTTCVDCFDSASAQARVRVVAERDLGAEELVGAATERILPSSPKSRTVHTDARSLTIKLVEAAAAVLDLVVGGSWAASVTAERSYDVSTVGRQTFTPSLTRWREFVHAFQRQGGGGVVARFGRKQADDYATLVELVDRLEQRRRALVDRCGPADQTGQAAFWARWGRLTDPLSKLHSKVAAYVDRNVRRTVDAEGGDRQARLTPHNQPHQYRAISDHVAKVAAEEWERLVADEGREEDGRSALVVERACRIETALLGTAARAADDQRIGYFVHNTRGVLRYVVCDSASAFATFKICFRDVFCDGGGMPDDQAQIARSMFEEVKTTMLSLSYCKQPYASIGNFHRNRVVVLFLCRAAFEAEEGTPRERKAAAKILESGFCFLTGEFGVHADRADRAERRSNATPSPPLVALAMATCRPKPRRGATGAAGAVGAVDPSMAVDFEPLFASFDEEGRPFDRAEEEERMVHVDNSVEALLKQRNRRRKEEEEEMDKRELYGLRKRPAGP